MQCIPELRFTGFVEEWKSIFLKDLMTFKNGLNASKERYGYGIKYINVLDILKNDFITYENILDSVEATDKQIEIYKVEYGDILFQRSSETREEVGLVNVYLDKEKNSIFGGFVIRGKNTADYVPFFLKELFKTKNIRKEITSRSGGSTRYNIGHESLKKIKIKLPSLKEQEKIAIFLSKVDEKIRLLEEKQEIWKTYQKGIMQQIFSQKLRFKDGNGEDYPDWEERKLGDFSKKIREKNQDNTIKNVFSNSAVNGLVLQQDFFDKDIANKDNLSGYYIVKKNYFVYNPRISKFAPVGPINVNKTGVIGLVSPIYTVFTIKDNKVDLSFIDQFFSTKEWHSYMRSVANYGARHDRMNITNHDFFEMPINLPSLQEQEKVAKFIHSIITKLAQIKFELEINNEFKKGLLQQMFC